MAKFDSKYVMLRNGLKMPLLGLGTWEAVKGDIIQAVEFALDCGYRHIDTATLYMNEVDVGKGINQWLAKSPENKREDLFVVTKLPMVGMNKGGVEKFLKLSLQKLNLVYIDLYLIHCPVGFKGGDENNLLPKINGVLQMDYATDLMGIWREMEQMVDEGLTKSIGVSNCTVPQMRRIDAMSRIPMVTNQVEMHVHHQQREIRDYCKEMGTVLTAYGVLGSPGRKDIPTNYGKPPNVFEDPVVKLVAANHSVTTAQIMIKFAMQLGVVALVKSANKQRIQSNADVYGFTLNELEMAALETLCQGGKARSFRMLTNLIGATTHPECPDLTWHE